MLLRNLPQREYWHGTRSEASTALAAISTFQFLCFLNIWGNILPEVDNIQSYLQTKGLGLHQSPRAVESLYKFLTDQRGLSSPDQSTSHAYLCFSGHSSCTLRTQEVLNGW